ncbi:MAG: hypothetical protein EOP82_21635 [Variovorax sp.]|nr:MAG: hypothetical protein EOP82_21635 [Variovorax sp.]
MAALDMPFEDQILVFRTRLTQRGLASALELLNDRTQFRYTAVHKVTNGTMRPVCVFDRLREDRAYLRSAFFLEALGRLTAANGGFVTTDCSQDSRLKQFGGLIVSYCGLVLAPLAGSTSGVLCHFDVERRKVKPCELAFLRAVAPLLLEHLD